MKTNRNQLATNILRAVEIPHGHRTQCRAIILELFRHGADAHGITQFFLWAMLARGNKRATASCVTWLTRRKVGLSRAVEIVGVIQGAVRGEHERR